LAFAAKYAGYIAQPRKSPGAWIAFRHSDVNNLQMNLMQQQGLPDASRNAALSRYTGDYTFLMDRLPDKTTVQTNIGPDDQRYGAWARLLPAGESIRLTFDDAFTSSLEGKKSVVHITYLDSVKGSFTTTVSGQTFKTILNGTGKWLTADYTLTQTHLAKDSIGAQITVLAQGADIYFHMVELTR
jgi:hypothetical protein